MLLLPEEGLVEHIMAVVAVVPVNILQEQLQ